MSNELFDKIINVEFLSNKNQEALLSDKITTPDTGRKPFISIKGQLHARTEINTIELRIANLYLSKELSEYEIVKVTVGYRDGEQGSISGSIRNSYVETPPPDSITVFELNLGKLNLWSSTWVTKNYDSGSLVKNIFSYLAKLLELNLNYNVQDNLTLKKSLNLNCLVQDAIFKLKKQFPSLVVFPTLNYLNVCDEHTGSQKNFELTYIKKATKDASGFTIQGLWNPSILPMDTVKLKPAYFKQSYGGQNVTGSKFLVVTVDFEFDTKKTNNMNLMTTEVK